MNLYLMMVAYICFVLLIFLLWNDRNVERKMNRKLPNFSLYYPPNCGYYPVM